MTFQWYRSGVAISKATKASHTWTAADIGYQLKAEMGAIRQGRFRAEPIDSHLTKRVEQAFADRLVSLVLCLAPSCA